MLTDEELLRLTGEDERREHDRAPDALAAEHEDEVERLACEIADLRARLEERE